MPTIDLTDDELVAVTAAVRRAIETDGFPHAPRLDAHSAGKVEAAAEPTRSRKPPPAKAGTRRHAAEIVAMRPDRADARRVLAIVDAIMNLTLPPPPANRGPTPHRREQGGPRTAVSIAAVRKGRA